MTEDTNFSRHQNLFNTLHNMGYILLESELQEVVSAVEKDKMEDNEFVQFAEYFRHNFDYYDDTESGSVYKWREFGKRKESPNVKNQEIISILTYNK